MKSTYQLEERVYSYMDTLFAGDQAAFGFNSSASACFFVDRQTGAPRLAASTLMYYRVGTPESVGNSFSDRPYFDRSTGIEKIDIHRQVKVTLNVLSTLKGCAKDTLSYLQLINQSTRRYDAAYNTGDFDFALSRIDRNARDLSSLETSTWVERIEAYVYFNYTDTITLNQPLSLIEAPSSVSATKDKIDFDIEFK